ncbi:MAG: hypothetical protein MI919_13100, partial [Holophagales bacterium]|nr:hypothetical protein [Holophagales bacterium]
MAPSPTETFLAPPVAERRANRRVLHGHILSDPYAWLRQRGEPEVLEHLRAENAYTDEVMGESAGQVERLYREIVERIPENDASVPVLRGPYLYYELWREGMQYPVCCRRPRSDDGAEEEVLLDLETLAAGGYLSLGAFRPSPDHRLLAYSVDTEGSERYRLTVLELATGALVDTCIEGTADGVEWSADGRYLFYTTRDSSERPSRIWRHRLGTDPSTDVLVFEEPDERFYLTLSKTRSERFLLLHIRTHTTTEVRALDAGRPREPFRLLARRREGVELEVDHQHGRFLLRTNLGAEAFRVLEVPEDALDGAPAGPRAVAEEEDTRAGWCELLPARPEVMLEGLEAFRGHLVLACRCQGLRRVEVWPLPEGQPPSGEGWHQVAMDEEVSTVDVEENPVYDTTVLRFSYASFLTPRSVYDYDMVSRERVL